MRSVDLLTDLERAGIELWVEGERLRFRAAQGALTPEWRARIAQDRPEIVAALRARSQASVSHAPMSYNQRGLWFVQQSAPQSAAYHVAFAARICSPVDVQALRLAVQALVDRHSSLRTTFAIEEGQPVQRIHGYLPARFEQVSAAGRDDEALRELVLESYREPLDLANGPLTRVTLFTRGEADHVLLLTVHHIVVDGWSLWILLDELRALYQANTTGEPVSLPRPSMTSQEFMRWETEMLAGPEGERLWAFWRSQLGGELPTLELPADRLRPPLQRLSGGSSTRRIDPVVSAQVREFARAQGTTLFTVMLSAWIALLHRLTGQTDIIIGFPTFGRNRPEFESFVANMINMTPLRASVQPTLRFPALLGAVRDSVVAALDHQEFPFPKLVEKLGVVRDPSRTPVFQVGFNLQQPQRSGDLAQLGLPDRPEVRVEFGGLVLEPYPFPQQEGQFDLILDTADLGGSLVCTAKFNADLFDRSTIEAVLKRFERLLAGVVAVPHGLVGDLPLLDEPERHRMLVDWNATKREFPVVRSTASLFEAQAASRPNAVAVRAGGEELTYAELDTRANQLAHHLRRLGVESDTLVAIGMERSVRLLIALMAVWKAGGAYVPLDSAYPSTRLAYMLKDSGAPVLVTEATLRDVWPDTGTAIVCVNRDAETISAYPVTPPAPMGSVDNLAYLLYTSGSTGKPKGVEMPHRALMNFLQSSAEGFPFGADDVTFAMATLSFDIAGLDLYLPLITGGRVELATREEIADPVVLRRRMSASGATLMIGPSSFFRLLWEGGWTGDPGMTLGGGGDIMDREYGEALLTRSKAAWNLYGPTETTIFSTWHPIAPGGEGPVPIGRPIANTEAYVLDERLQPVPVGVAGELHIGGAGLARAYRGRPDLTAEQFIPDPFSGRPGARLYRTGDLARWNREGHLECLGRTDHQVKVRGFRIELGEIAAVLERHPGLKESFVVVHHMEGNDGRLVAYVVPGTGEPPTTSELRRFLKKELPAHMVPSFFVEVPAIPLTATGKVDRKALPNPLGVARSTQARVGPRTPAEQMVARVWREVLGTKDIWVDDNFYEIGGHSLLSVQAISRIEQECGVRLMPARFMVDTLEQIAAACERIGTDPTPTPLTTTAGEAQRRGLLGVLKDGVLGSYRDH